MSSNSKRAYTKPLVRELGSIAAVTAMMTTGSFSDRMGQDNGPMTMPMMK